MMTTTGASKAKFNPREVEFNCFIFTAHVRGIVKFKQNISSNRQRHHFRQGALTYETVVLINLLTQYLAFCIQTVSLWAVATLETHSIKKMRRRQLFRFISWTLLLLLLVTRKLREQHLNMKWLDTRIVQCFFVEFVPGDVIGKLG